MKRRTKQITIFCVSVFFLTSSCQEDALMIEDTDRAVVEVLSKQVASINSDEEGLKFMREEEKLAHDVYFNLYKLWRKNIFKNISKSEVRHTKAIQRLLTFYNIDDPALPGIGVFTNPDLQDLYNDLMAKGEKSLIDAYEVGEIIELTDIDDIEYLITLTTEARIINVYTNLLKGSKNHLAAFRRQLNR